MWINVGDEFLLGFINKLCILYLALKCNLVYFPEFHGWEEEGFLSWSDHTLSPKSASSLPCPIPVPSSNSIFLSSLPGKQQKPLGQAGSLSSAHFSAIVHLLSPGLLGIIIFSGTLNLSVCVYKKGHHCFSLANTAED